jgi:hypothetical protein
MTAVGSYEKHPCLARSDAGLGRPSAEKQVEARPDLAVWEASDDGRIGAACAPAYTLLTLLSLTTKVALMVTTLGMLVGTR